MKNFLYLLLLCLFLFLPFFVKSKENESCLSLFKKNLLATTIIDEHNIDIPKLEKKQEKNLYTTYIVKLNDTLWSISSKFGLDISTIISANNLKTNILKEGTKLKIPMEKGIVYKIKRGETLWDIAKRFNISLDKIKEVNEISTIVKKDQEIFLPGASLPKSKKTIITQNFFKGFVKPIAGNITSGFGLRLHPIFQRVHFHRGIDINSPYGSFVKAAESGRVIFAGWKSGYGRCIIIKHDNIYKTLYGHLSKIFVRNNQFVEKNECIGEVGNSGLTTGAHLHFEILKNNQSIDPRKLIY